MLHLHNLFPGTAAVQCMELSMTNPSRLRGRPKSKLDKTEQNTVQALDRALGLLERLAASAGLTLSELAERSALPIATVFRALVTLQGHGFVTKFACQSVQLVL